MNKQSVNALFGVVSIVTDFRMIQVCMIPVYSPNISLDIMTVKMGAELFTVSANDTAMLFRLTSPNTTVVNLTGKQRGKD